jgi:hypothetical protein
LAASNSPTTWAAALAVVTVLLAAATVVLSLLVRRDLLESAGQPLLVTVPFATVGVIVARRQPSNPMGWLLAGVGVLVMLANLGSLYALLDYHLGVIVGLFIAALPVGIGVGILKYRLYEIDRIISRTLAYAIVTGLLAGLYAGLVLLATRVLSFHTPVAVAASTLAAAALFYPLRRRVQRAVDRRFNRARYDADQMVAAFAARLKDEIDLDLVRDDLAAVVQQALEPAHLSVWVSRRG